MNDTSGGAGATEAVGAELKFNGYEQSKNPARGFDEDLVRVGPGTPCGEYLRRFWQPVIRTREVEDLPVPIRRFGEDLLVFRDGSGRYALTHRHCPHRNASLEFGTIEQRGIRCCYHGWHYDIDGTLIEAPAEPRSARLSERVRLGAYPCREYRGLVFAYLGPGAPPEFPRFDTCEIDGGELLAYEVPLECNWLQVAENSMDPLHVVFLHTRVNGAQFHEKLGILPVLHWVEREIGFFYLKARRMGEHVWMSTNDIVLPNFTQAGLVYESPDGSKPHYFTRNSFTRWIVPVDDTNTVVLAFRHFNPHAEQPRDEWRTEEAMELIDISRLRDRPYQDRQRDPGDYEALAGQGPITTHANEHLASSDAGVVRYRRRLKAEIEKLSTGQSLLPQTAGGISPIPTYGSDSVIFMPADDAGENDGEAVAALLTRVANIYMSADKITGEERFKYLAERLAELNA